MQKTDSEFVNRKDDTSEIFWCIRCNCVHFSGNRSKPTCLPIQIDIKSEYLKKSTKYRNGKNKY